MKRFLLCFLLLCLVVCGFAQKRGSTSRIRLYLAPQDFGKLSEEGIDFDHGYYDASTGTYINEFDTDVVQQIARLGYRYDVLVADVAAYTDSLNKSFLEGLNAAKTPAKNSKGMNMMAPQIQAIKLNFTTSCQSFDASITTPSTFRYGSMGGFYNLTELEAQINDMVSSFPALVSKTSIGNSLQGRPVWVVKISDNVANDENEPEVLYTGMHHAREGMSMMNLIYYMRYLLANYNSNAAIKEIVDSRELFFIPVVNIDGFNFNTTATNWNAGRNMRRKNMQETTNLNPAANGSGGDGVDINRNYPQYWGANFATTSITGQTGSSGAGESDAFRGSQAGSEIETRNMMNFVNARKFKVALNYHCYGNWWIRAGGPDEVTHPSTKLSAANINIYNSIAALFTRYNCYVYGNPKQTVYPVNGYSDDWMFSGTTNTQAPIFSFSPEIGTSTDGFWCPQARIEPLAKEQLFPNLQAAYVAGSYAELTDLSDVALTTMSGSFDFLVVRRGLTAGDVKVSITPVSGVSTGAPVAIGSASLANYGSTFRGSIAYTLPTGIQPGTAVRFTWQLETGGITIKETVTRIYSPITVLADDMNTNNFATKWVAGTRNTWNYVAGMGIDGTAALAEAAGNYGTNANHTVRLAAPLDLSGSAKAYLSYLIRYNTENCQDKLRLEISTNGINGTYNPICGQTMIKENRLTMGNVPAYTGSTDNWIREVIDLSSYAGNSNIGLQFRFQSNGSNEEAYTPEGFYIDNLKVIKSNEIVLPVVFEDLNAARQDNKIKLVWKAQVIGLFSHYVVERSADGVHFEPVATIYNPEVYQYTDGQPLRGSNYYRVRGVDADGTSRYSNMAHLVFEPMNPITGYPNPTRGRYTVEMQSAFPGQALVILQDATGKLIMRKTIALTKGINKIPLQLPELPNQFYLIQVRNREGSILYTDKIFKLN